MQILAFDGACRSRYSGHADPKVGDEVFVMLPESVQYLADLANARAMPTLPEEAWKLRTGVNPVELALRYEKYYFRRVMGATCIAFGIGFLITVVISSVLFSWSVLDDRHKLSGELFGAVFGLQITIAVFLSVIGCMVHSGLTLPDTKEIDKFWEAYNHFHEWSRVPNRFDLPLDPEKLATIATDLLIEAADPLLEYPGVEDMTEEQRDLYLPLRRMLDDKFDTCKHLGLAQGGLGPYFKKARQRREQKERSSQSAAI